MNDTTTAEKPGTALVVAGTLMTPAIFQDPEKIEDVLARLEREVRSLDRDISTPEGRSQIASVAYKIARSKTALDEMGKNLVADWKKSADLVDAERRKIRARCDALKDEFRAPLTEWEQAEERRVASHQAALDNLQRLADMTGIETSTAASVRIHELGQAYARSWEEFAVRASTVYELATMRLDKRLEVCRKAEAEAARLEAERIAQEAAERARQEAEQRAEIERAEQEERNRRELERREMERQDQAELERRERDRLERKRLEREEAERIERELEQRAQALREARLQEEREAAEQRAREAEQQAADRAARAAAEAAAAERRRIEDAQAAAQAEQERRENNRRIQARVHNAILQALFKECGLDEPTAKRIVVAIAAGKVPNVSIRY